MKRLCTTLALMAMCALLVPMQAHANHSGCYVLGEVQGLDTERHCTYTALTGTQNVYVGTPLKWKVWVLRGTPSAPIEVTLAEGTGIPAGPPPQVHPNVGETVHVTMYVGFTGPFLWTFGFLGAGLEEAHP
jgi:hypothetical protein